MLSFVVTLFLVPSAYYLMHREKQKKRRRCRHEEQALFVAVG